MSKPVKPVKEFTRANCRTLMDEVEAALKPIAEKHGLTLDRKGKSFYRDKLPVMFQFLVTEKDEDGNALDSRAKDFMRVADAYGLSKDDYLAEFRSNGRTFRITGLNTRARGYPVMAEDVRTGKTYKFPAKRVKQALEQSKAA